MPSKQPIDDGGPAFPSAADTPEGHQMKDYGMSLRDYFAGQALAGMFSSKELYDAMKQIREHLLESGVDGMDAHTKFEFPVYAKASYAIADAMLAARKDTNGS